MSILLTQIGFLDYKHAGASCSRFGEPAMKLPASRKVRSSLPSGRGMGSSEVRCQPLSGINP
jgi:hypothetical protein